MDPRIPTSERLQKKIWAVKDPDSTPKQKFWYLIHFVKEGKYSVVEGRHITSPDNPRVTDSVVVTDTRGHWEGIVVSKGSKEWCVKKQTTLSLVLNDVDQGEDQSVIIEDYDDQAASEHQMLGKRKYGVANSASCTFTGGSKGGSSSKKPKATISKDFGEDEKDGEVQWKKAADDELASETSRVKKLLKTSATMNQKAPSNSCDSYYCIERSPIRSSADQQPAAITPEILGEFLEGVYSMLDSISGEIATLTKALGTAVPFLKSEDSSPARAGHLRRQLVSAHSPTSSGPNSAVSSPSSVDTASSDQEQTLGDPDFTVGGIHLIKDVAAKGKKPTLYATSLMTNLFTNEEMRDGCVEPKEGATNGKTPLEQRKINLIKKCIKTKYSEKVLEKSWPEIRKSMNQKCLDKVKLYRRSLPNDVQADHLMINQ